MLLAKSQPKPALLPRFACVLHTAAGLMPPCHFGYLRCCSQPAAVPAYLWQVLYPPERYAELAAAPPQRKAPLGLANVGNSCYANSLLQSLIATPALAAYLVSGGRYTRSAFLAAISGMPRSPVAVRRNVGRRAVCLQRMHRQSTHCSWPNIGKPLISACFYHLAQASTAAAASSRLPTSGARCASWRSWRSRRTARAAGASAPSRWCVLRWGGVKINGCRPAAVGP